MSALSLSLPPHLREALEPLRDVLPPELNALVIEALNSTEIQFNTVADISKWVFTEEGEEVLKTKNLNPKDYDRVSLLAGTITGPSKRLPPPDPKPEPWEVAQEQKNTRRAIAALVNGLFSVVGIATAVWWASKTTGWSYEFRIGLSILGGLVTAIAEGGLFIIYYKRREQEKEYREKLREKEKRRRQNRYLRRLKEDNAAPETNISSTVEHSEDQTSVSLRKRVIAAGNSSEDLLEEDEKEHRSI